MSRPAAGSSSSSGATCSVLPGAKGEQGSGSSSTRDTASGEQQDATTST
jgi:hypothetical protein